MHKEGRSAQLRLNWEWRGIRFGRPLGSAKAPRYQRPKRPNPKLALFTEAIEHMMFEQGFIGSHIIRELEGRGYQGGATAVYAYLRTLRTGRPDRRITERFETAPGQEGCGSALIAEAGARLIDGGAGRASCGERS